MAKYREKIFLDEDSLIEESFQLATQIMASGFKPTFIVGLWRGGSSVGIYVQECLQTLGVKTDHISIRTSYAGFDSYQKQIHCDKPIRVHGLTYLVKKLNLDDRLLIVDDMYRSGKNANAVINELQKRLKKNMPADVRVATVWKKDALPAGSGPDYYVHATDHWVVFPYELQGLSLEEIKQYKSFAYHSIDRELFIES
ncbi:MAG: hypoxanthine phosphoribosyltransferase [Psychromonas sp.]